MQFSKFFVFAFVLLANFSLFAQSPSLINYQAVLRDNTGSLITSGSQTIRISIYSDVVGGSALYTEDHNVTPNQYGLVSFRIGGGTQIGSNAFANIDWSTGEKWLDIQLNGTTIGNRTQLVSVPFAIQANNGVPVGTVVAFMGITPPAGWVLCDGSELSRSTYATLFSVMGVSCGSGNGSTTFNLPDMRGRFLRGTDDGAGNDPDAAGRTAMNTGGNTGDAVGSLQNDEFKNHSHRLLDSGYPIIQVYQVTPSTGNLYAPTWGPGATVNNMPNSQAVGGNETRPRNANVNYIIKVQ